MIAKTERIDSQCPCGQPLTAVLLYRQKTRIDTTCVPPKRTVEHTTIIKIYVTPIAGQKRTSITRCPLCDRDFTRLTEEQVKEGVWTS
jgi:hypothetical protein